MKSLIKISPSEPSSTYRLLLRTITASPGLATYILHVTLVWTDTNEALHNRTRSFLERKRETFTKIDQLLERLSNLQSLEICPLRSSTDPYIPRILQINPAHPLRKVAISDFRATVNEVAWYLAHPNLRELDIGFVDPLIELKKETLASLKRKGSPGAAISVLRLGISTQTHLPPEELRNILSIPSSVHTLYCAIPGREENENLFRGLDTPMVQPLSPARIAWALLPIRERLVNLALCDSFGSIWPSHDLSRMDLSDFNSLQKLHIPSSCFFSSSSPQEIRQDVWTILPKTIRELSVSSMSKMCMLRLSRLTDTYSGYQIWFNLRSSFLFTESDLAALSAKGQRGAKTPAALVQTKRYKWVTEILDHKVEDLPQLKSISIQEAIEERFGLTNDGFDDYGFLGDLHHAAAAAEVSLGLFLRKPRDRSREASRRCGFTRRI